MKKTITKKKPQKTTFLHMRCTDEDKTKWQKCADFQGIPLSKWITFALDRHARRTEHYIRVDPPERE